MIFTLSPIMQNCSYFTKLSVFLTCIDCSKRVLCSDDPHLQAWSGSDSEWGRRLAEKCRISYWSHSAYPSYLQVAGYCCCLSYYFFHWH